MKIQATNHRSTWLIILCLLVYGPITFADTSRLGFDPELRTELIKAVNEADSFNDRFDAEVWLMDMSNRLQKRLRDKQERMSLLRLVHHEAARVDLPPEMVLAVIQTESNFNRWAISVAGAQGLMQVMPFWLKEIGRDGDSLFSIKTNLRLGCTILRHYYDKEHGDWTKALARYNGSIGKAIYPRKVFNNLRAHWFKR